MNKRIQTLTCTSMALLLLLTGCGQADSGAFAAEDTVTDYLVSPEKTPVEKSKGAAVETSSEAGEAATLEDTMNELTYTTPDGETGYLYIPQSVLEKPEKKVPMVLMMMCTGGMQKPAAGWIRHWKKASGLAAEITGLLVFQTAHHKKRPWNILTFYFCASPMETTWPHIRHWKAAADGRVRAN